MCMVYLPLCVSPARQRQMPLPRQAAINSAVRQMVLLELTGIIEPECSEMLPNVPSAVDI